MRGLLGCATVSSSGILLACCFDSRMATFYHISVTLASRLGKQGNEARNEKMQALPYRGKPSSGIVTSESITARLALQALARCVERHGSSGRRGLLAKSGGIYSTRQEAVPWSLQGIPKSTSERRTGNLH